ncbi:MAG: PQQ-binding-like beta-propeller repeat protein [Phycisphaerae bacterium]|jgi:outer membrane protein assembly factor BamB|nr:PQQ-binding-like beta-propeller repeat protein [Phycisphaerae bacterium]
MNKYMRAAAGLVIAVLSAAAVADEAAEILETTGVKGGLVVHLGCGDGRLTAALRASDAFVVHGLEGDSEKVAAGRRHIASLGLSGKVSVERFSGKSLPYAENLVNLLVCENLGPVPMSEVMRVLAPNGAARIRTGGKWITHTKRQPDDMDDWSHFLHDAGNNAVARDRLVGPPRRIQWIAPPLWLRSHETASGVQAQIAAGGKLFYIFDEGLIGITDERLPARWSVICRDAFNGKMLWRIPLPKWGWRQWGKSRFEGKDWLSLRAARVSAPVQNQRRLVADSERLYATLGFDAPLSILDAATGKVIVTVKGTESTDEILVSEGIVLAHVRKKHPPIDAPKTPKNRKGRKPRSPGAVSMLVGVKADTGKIIWKQGAGGSIRPLAVAIDNSRVFYTVGKKLACVDLKTGKKLWDTQLKTQSGRTMAAANGVVLILGAVALDSYDAVDGKLLWNKKIPSRAGFENVDLFVVGDLVWPGIISTDTAGKPTRKSANALALGFDIRTGSEKKRIVARNLRSPEHHHRCYRNKATSRYIISSLEGAEFMDLESDGHLQNNWVRGACKLGMMPCYGLLYVPSDQCFCQPGGKLLGYAAIAAKSNQPTVDVPDADRLEKGSAYRTADKNDDQADALDWPTYRHDPQRHGSTTASIPANITQEWRVKLGGRLTQPVVARGKLFVASIDAHRLYALDVASGKELWRFVADGRIDSPPTFHRGKLLFGSADGRVYCLRASDGAVVWRFLAAPRDRRIMYFDQVESAWPVHGSVLVRNNIAYVAAGRSTYLDGGIRFYGLNPSSGKIIHKGLIEGPHRTAGGKRDVAFYVDGANSDVLVSEGDYIYMRQKKLSAGLKEIVPEVLSSKGEADVGMHVFSTSGLLDASWYNRAFWMYSKRWPGFQLANQAPKTGQILVVDKTTTYALRAFYHRNVHSPMFFPGKRGYLLFADKNTNEPQIVGEPGAREPVKWLPQSDYSRGGRGKVKFDSKAFGGDKMMGYTRAEAPLWTLWLPVRVKAMVKTRDILFVAGPPDVYDAKDPFAAFEGRKGASLAAVSAKTGKKLAELKLRTPPVFDGMIAIEGRLCISLSDGSIVSYAPSKTP